MRALALCVVAGGSLAFAPAPLPRPERGRQQDDLARLQGWWRLVRHNGQPMDVTFEVKGDTWNNNSPNDRWTMTLEPRAHPRRIYLKGIVPQKGHFHGIYKWEGDR